MLFRRSLAVVTAALALVAGASSAGATETPAAPDEQSPTVVVQAEAAADGYAEAERIVAAMPVRAQAASVVMAHIPTADPATLNAYMTAGGYGGFILMGANVPPSEEELRAVTAALTVDASLPPLLAIDEEGGDVTRLPWDALPSARVLKDQPASEAAQAFAARGSLLARAGLGANFGVVADVTADPSMFIYRRALGTTPSSSSERVAAAVAGEAPFALSTLKHFPGHGAAPGDSHRGIPSTAMSREEWRTADALPFEAGIDAGARLLMFGHLSYTAVDPTPASLSPTWHAIARDDLGFRGVAVTDDLGMLQASGDPAYSDPVANAVLALAAGNDMVLTVLYSTPETAPRVVTGIEAAVAEGRLEATRLQEAATRVVELRLEAAPAGEALLPCADCEPAN